MFPLVLVTISFSPPLDFPLMPSKTSLAFPLYLISSPAFSSFPPFSHHLLLPPLSLHLLNDCPCSNLFSFLFLLNPFLRLFHKAFLSSSTPFPCLQCSLSPSHNINSPPSLRALRCKLLSVLLSSPRIAPILPILKTPFFISQK